MLDITWCTRPSSKNTGVFLQNELSRRGHKMLHLCHDSRTKIKARVYFHCFEDPALTVVLLNDQCSAQFTFELIEFLSSKGTVKMCMDVRGMDANRARLFDRLERHPKVLCPPIRAISASPKGPTIQDDPKIAMRAANVLKRHREEVGRLFFDLSSKRSKR